MKKLVILSCLLFSSGFLKAEVKELHSTIVNFSNPWYNGYPVLLSENELPQELPQFEEGRVQQALTNLLKEIKYLLPILVQQTDTYRKKL